MDEITRRFKKKDIDDLNKIAKVGSVDYLLYGHFTGYMEALKYLNQHKYYEYDDFKDRKITNSEIINSFMKRYNMDYGSVSEITMRRKLTNMIEEIDSDFFGC